MSTQVLLHDDDKLQLPSDVGTWRPVRELRALGYTEPQLESIADFGAVERRGAWYTVRELRSGTSATVEQLQHDPYAKDLALKTASAAPETSFEDKWKADRLAALDAEYRRLDAHINTHPTPRVAEGRKTYPPPNSYEAGIQALAARDARALAAKENR